MSQSKKSHHKIHIEHSNILIVCSGNKPDFDFQIHQAFVYDQVSQIEKTDRNLKFDYFFIKGKGCRGYLRNLKFLKAVLKQKKYDLIHAHFTLSGLLAGLQRRVPVVTTFHGSDINITKLRYVSLLVEILSKKTIYVSQKLISKAIFSSKKHSFVIPCGVDTDLFRPIDTEIAKAKTGLNSKKNYILFSSAFDNIIKNFHLLQQAQLNINNREIEVIELKNYSREKVMLLMNAVDVCVMTSFSEGSPQFIKEAMACNCPIVATDVGDIREVVGSTEGHFITSFDPQDVADKIKKAFAFGKRTNGRKKNKHLDNKIIVEQIVSVYKQILEKTK